MISQNCQTVFFCPFKAEATMIAMQLNDCRRVNSKTWSTERVMIFTWNGAGFLPLHQFLDCFPIEELKSKKIILFGSAGSVDDNHQPGQIFALDKVQFEEKTIELPPIDGLPSILSKTEATPVLSPFLRADMLARHGSCLIDQESFHFVEYFQKHSIKVQVIRFVSDTPSFEFRLPFPKALVNRFSHDWNLFNKD